MKVVKWLFNEAQNGKDMCDRVIGTEKGHLEFWVDQGNDAATAGQVCGLSRMDTLKGNHKTFVLQPTPAELEKALPLKGGTGSNAKQFTL